MACPFKSNKRCEAVTSTRRAGSSRRTDASIFTGSASSSFGCDPGILKPLISACRSALPRSAERSALSVATCNWPGTRSRATSKCPSALSERRLPSQRPRSTPRSQPKSGRGDIAADSNAKARSADKSFTLRLPSACPFSSPACSESSSRSAARGPLRLSVASSAPRPGSDKIFSKGPLAGSCTLSAASMRCASKCRCNSY